MITPATRPGASHPVAPYLAYAIFALVCAGNLWYSLTIGGLDFTVYRTGAMTVFNNEGFDKELYVIDLMRLGPDFSLPFTYPTFAAILFVPFAFLPKWAGILAMMLLAYGVSWWLSSLIYDYANKRGKKIPFQDTFGRSGTIALLAAIILLSGPWRRGLGLVQVNPLIMLLVLWDFVRPATRVPRGVFIGIAGGIKLTPLAFGLILLMRKDIKGVLTLGLSFLATLLIGFICLPSETIEFWMSAVSDPSRVGNINYLDNISIQGWLMHLGLGQSALLKGLQYALILLLLIGVALVIPILEKQGMLISQLALNAFLMLSMSPISWSHHNTWLPLMAAALWLDAAPVFMTAAPAALRRIWQLLAWGAVLGLYISPMWLGIALYGSDDDLDYISPLPLLVSALPIICLFVVVLTWIAYALRNRDAPLAGEAAVTS